MVDGAGGRCGKEYRAGIDARRACDLGAGHDGPCHGAIVGRIFAGARAKAKDKHAAMEAGQRAARAAAAPAIPGDDLTPDQFAIAILGALRDAAAALSPRQIAMAIGAKMVNRRPAGAKEVNQMLHRLQRDGQAIDSGGGHWRAA